VYALAFSPDGKLLAAGAGRSGFVDDPSENWFGRGGGLYLHDVSKGECVVTFPTPNDDITAVAFAPDGSLLFAGSTDCSVRVVDVSTRQEIAVLRGHVGGVNSLAFSPDGKTLASAGGDGLVRLWPWRQILGRPEQQDTATAPAGKERRGGKTPPRTRKKGGPSRRPKER
jgi:WD40 repeat protein